VCFLHSARFLAAKSPSEQGIWTPQAILHPFIFAPARLPWAAADTIDPAMKSLIFDLDGTLVETAPDLIETLNVILTREGYPPVDYHDARLMVGAGVKTLLARGLSAVDGPVAQDRLDRLYQDYLSHYAEHIADLSRPFPGMEDALDALAAQGWRLAVCTNKLEWLSVRLLETLKLKDRFAAICGQDTFGIAKPDPEVLLRTIAAAGGDAAQAIMIGDSITDIATAKAARIPVIAVDFGYTDVPVRELGPDRVISHFDGLAEAVAALRG
jgi:phosphoglycolate phosphatase